MEHSAVRIQNSMIIFGGMTRDGPTGDVWQYNFNNNQWNVISVQPDPFVGIPEARSEHKALVVGNDMFIFGIYFHSHTCSLTISFPVLAMWT